MSNTQLDIKLTDQLEREWMADEFARGFASTDGESILLIGFYLAVVAFAVGAAWLIVSR